MTLPYPPTLLRRGAAVLLILLVGAVGWELVADPLLDAVESRQDEVETLELQLGRVQAIAARRPELEEQAKILTTRSSQEGALWSGSGTVSVAAAVQDLLRNASVSAGGHLRSTSQSEAGDEHGVRRVTVRFSQDGTIETMQRVLEAISRSEPALFVDELSVTSTEPTRDFPPGITMELTVTAYMRQPAPP